MARSAMTGLRRHRCLFRANSGLSPTALRTSDIQPFAALHRTEGERQEETFIRRTNSLPKSDRRPPSSGFARLTGARRELYRGDRTAHRAAGALDGRDVDRKQGRALFDDPRASAGRDEGNNTAAPISGPSKG